MGESVLSLKEKNKKTTLVFPAFKLPASTKTFL